MLLLILLDIDDCQSRWYEASDPPGGHSLFTDSNIKRHAHDRRMVASGFSMTALLEMEDFVSDCVKVFETRLREFADNGHPVDMGHWLQCYAFDVIGEITASVFARGPSHSLTCYSLQSVLVSWIRVKTLETSYRRSKGSCRIQQRWAWCQSCMHPTVNSCPFCFLGASHSRLFARYFAAFLSEHFDLTLLY